jgi:drug/metabolite transporter, DME family
MSQFITPEKTSRSGLGPILCAAISWGTVGITTQALYNLSPTNALSIGFFRLAIAALILLVACSWHQGRRIMQIRRRDAVIMVLIGCMLALYQACYFTAISYCGIAVAALTTLCTAPVIVTIASLTITRERLTATTAIALVCAVGGTALLVAARSTTGILNPSLIGIPFAIAAACGYAGVILGGRRLAGQYHPLHINMVAFGAGAIVLLCLALPTRFVISYHPQEWLLLLYLGSIPTALAYGLFMIGIRSTSATITSIVTLCEPLTSALLAWIFFGERLGAPGLLGALLLLSAILLLAKKKQLPKPKDTRG